MGTECFSKNVGNVFQAVSVGCGWAGFKDDSSLKLKGPACPRLAVEVNPVSELVLGKTAVSLPRAATAQEQATQEKSPKQNREVLSFCLE